MNLSKKEREALHRIGTVALAGLARTFLEVVEEACHGASQTERHQIGDAVMHAGMATLDGFHAVARAVRGDK